MYGFPVRTPIYHIVPISRDRGVCWGVYFEDSGGRIFIHPLLRFSVASERIAAFFWAPQVSSSPRKTCDFSLRRKIASDCDSFCDFSRKTASHCGLAGNRDVCDKKSRRFAIAIFGALSCSLGACLHWGGDV